MKNFKFELIVAYYKRPEIVKNALQSIKENSYENWHLSFIDDSGDDFFRDTFFNFGFDAKKIEYIPILMSDEDKNKAGGSIFGKYINDVIVKSDSDIVILICDDDALTENYLIDLNNFYQININEKWSYCHLNFYNPDKESYKSSKYFCENIALNKSNLNAFTERINPFCKVDSSQVSFRRDAMIDKSVYYPYPKTANLDADIFMRFFQAWGSCPFNGIVGQHKGWFENQLGVRIRTGKGFFIKN